MELRRRARALAGRRNAAGFTLLEIVIAMGVLAFGLLGLAAMQLYSLSQGRQGRHTARASVVAQDRLEELQYIPFTSITAGSWSTVRTVNETVTGNATYTEVAYLVEQRVSNLTGGKTKAIDVRVTWDEPDEANKQIVMSFVRYDY